MTTEQYRHHDEQMDAARAEFNRIWDSEVVPQLRETWHLKQKDFLAVQCLCWNFFRHGKGLVK